MCGIAGFIDHHLPPASTGGVLQMLQCLEHRGPDGGVHYQAPPERGPLVMGMRRLSIIDLEGGTQPIWNEDHTIGVVFNGEIYNYVELRQSLRAAGHQFRTESDTEVLVHLYEAHGERLVEHLRGMFAFALFDTRTRSLLLARDHFGQKPLYYTLAEGRLAFASELKCLRELPWVDWTLDPAAYGDYVAWLSLPAPRTHFIAIHKLAAGSLLRVPLDQPRTARPKTYWRYDLTPAPDLHEMPAAVEALDAALQDSLAVHLRADVPLGVLLSSGLDSRTVAAYAQDALGGGMQTFTVGFRDADSELHEAAVTAREIKSRHHTLELSSQDLLDDLPAVAWHLDEPVGDPAAFAVRRICRLAREHVKVLLSGEGADELFGGYDTRYLGMRHTLARSASLRRWAPLLPQPDAAAPPTRWQRLLTRAHQSAAEESVALRLEGFPGDVRQPRGLSVAQLRTLAQRTTILSQATVRPQRDSLSSFLALDLDWQLAESLLQKADKMSMAASIELRTPLLDLRIAELAARIPSSLKLPPVGPGKLVLRQTLARKLNEPLTRPKKGFPIPLAQWFRGPLRGPVEDALFAPNSAALAYFEKPLLQQSWQDFQSGAWSEGARPFYALWLYETWRTAFPLK